MWLGLLGTQLMRMYPAPCFRLTLLSAQLFHKTLSYLLDIYDG